MINFFSYTFLLVVLATARVDLSQACPEGCFCTGTEVFCQKASLPRIPSTTVLPKSITTLNMKGTFFNTSFFFIIIIVVGVIVLNHIPILINLYQLPLRHLYLLAITAPIIKAISSSYCSSLRQIFARSICHWGCIFFIAHVFNQHTCASRFIRQIHYTTFNKQYFSHEAINNCRIFMPNPCKWPLTIN